MAAPVVIYAARTCPYCVRAAALLREKGVGFERRRIWLWLPGGRRPLAERFGPGHTSVPQIVIGDTHVGGCDELLALERSGGLDALLAG
jgi:glutaredoxin 3